jgi:hypothetical protein
VWLFNGRSPGERCQNGTRAGPRFSGDCAIRACPRDCGAFRSVTQRFFGTSFGGGAGSNSARRLRKSPRSRSAARLLRQHWFQRGDGTRIPLGGESCPRGPKRPSSPGRPDPEDEKEVRRKSRDRRPGDTDAAAPAGVRRDHRGRADCRVIRAHASPITETAYFIAARFARCDSARASFASRSSASHFWHSSSTMVANVVTTAGPPAVAAVCACCRS